MSNHKKLKRNRKYRYKKETISSSMKITDKYFNNTTLRIGATNDDYIKGLLSARLTSYILKRTLKEKYLYVCFDRPTFLDWLLRRKRKATVIVNVSELLSSNEKETVKVYSVDEI